jgi:hypothetical protein
MVGFRKGALGSPFSTEYQANEGMDLGNAERGEGAPRIGPGVLGKKVMMDVQRNSRGGDKRKGSREE